jgi:predicted  nucleic acid-binding Zn-ribbon protein
MERLNAEIADTEARLAETKRNVAEEDGEIDDTVRFILNDREMLRREKEELQDEENAFVAQHGIFGRILCASGFCHIIGLLVFYRPGQSGSV